MKIKMRNYYAVQSTALALTVICSIARAQYIPLGFIEPTGSIIVISSQPLTLKCHLNKAQLTLKYPDLNASDLYIYQNYDSKIIDKKYITILNETSIEMHIEHPSVLDDVFYCYLGRGKNKYNEMGYQVSYVEVTVCHEPRRPTDFNCIYRFNKYINCSYKHDYDLCHVSSTIMLITPWNSIPRRPDGLKNYMNPTPYWYGTWKLEEIKGAVIQYSMPTGHKWNYSFSEHGTVIPSAPTDLYVYHTTSESGLLVWEMPFSAGFHHRIEYKPYFSNKWKIIETISDPDKKEMVYNLTGLKYGDTLYAVRVSIKKIEDGEDKWSDKSLTNFYTKPTLPVIPPAIDSGSYETVKYDKTREIILYWQSVPPELENGDEFGYKINVKENSRAVPIKPIEITNNHARFINMSFHSYYHFEIFSKNIVGNSLQCSKILVPREHWNNEF